MNVYKLHHGQFLFLPYPTTKMGRPDIHNPIYNRGKRWRRGMGKPMKGDVKSDDRACLVFMISVLLLTTTILAVLYLVFVK